MTTDTENLRQIAAGNALTAEVEGDLEGRGLIVQTDQPYASLTAAGRGLLAAGSDETYFVDDLQACEPDELPRGTGVRVTLSEGSDDSGFRRATVEGPTAKAVLDFVREHWGDEDRDWFREHVVQRPARAAGPDDPRPPERLRSSGRGERRERRRAAPGGAGRRHRRRQHA